jgi:hypothetical protein
MRAVRSLAACVLGLGIVACRGDDPYAGVADDPCRPGHVRGQGGACAAPQMPIFVDGDATDWTNVARVPLAPGCRVAPCDDALAESVQLARAHDPLGRPALAFHVRLAGGRAPALGSDFAYALELSGTPELPTGTRDLLLVNGAGVRYLRSGFEVSAPPGLAAPFSAELTDDGFEAEVATDFLPFPYGANVAITAARRDDATHVWNDFVDHGPLVRACWNDSIVADAPYGGDLCAAGDVP